MYVQTTVNNIKINTNSTFVDIINDYGLRLDCGYTLRDTQKDININSKPVNGAMYEFHACASDRSNGLFYFKTTY